MIAQTTLNTLTEKNAAIEQELALYKQKVADLERVVKHFSETKKVQKALFQIVELTNSSQTIEAFYCALHKIVADLIPAKNFFIILINKEN